VVLIGGVLFASYKFGWLWWGKKDSLPPPSGKELRVHVLDVGQGDAILIVGPEKVALIDAGDEKSGQTVYDALKANNVQRIDYFILTHYHPDHIGGAAAVLANFKVGTVLENGFPPPEALPADETAAQPTPTRGADKKQGKSQPKQVVRQRKVPEFPTVKAYNSFKNGVDQAAASEEKTEFKKAVPDQRIDLGGGAILTVLAPVEPLFTREQFAAMRKGNESNANSIIVRLDYGEFSMLLPGDAEAQTEARLSSRFADNESALKARILKVAHHGSKYASSDDFLKRVKPEVAIISMSKFNRYGHPNQDVLNRLKAAEVRDLYRTDLQGEITIRTTGKVKDGKLYVIETKETKAEETKKELWVGREATKDDSSPNFITYGDYDPPKRQQKKK